MGAVSIATYVLIMGAILYGGFLLYVIRLFVRQTKLIAHMSYNKVSETLPKAKQARTSFVIVVGIADIVSWLFVGKVLPLKDYLEGLAISHIFFFTVIVGLQFYVHGLKKRLRELSLHGRE